MYQGQPHYIVYVSKRRSSIILAKCKIDGQRIQAHVKDIKPYYTKKMKLKREKGYIYTIKPP